MKKVILSLLVMLLPNISYPEDYFQWIKDNCTETVIWRCVGIFCITLVAADKVFPFVQKKIHAFCGPKEESIDAIFDRKIATAKAEIKNEYDEQIKKIRDDLKVTNETVIQNHADLIKLISDHHENYQLVFVGQDSLVEQKDTLMIEINAIKRIIEERTISLKETQEFVVPKRERVVKIKDETYSKRELDILLETFKKECNQTNKKILTKTKKVAKRHTQFFEDNKVLMQEIVDLKKEYVQTKDLVSVFAEESNKLTFDLFKFQARARRIDHSLQQLENPQSIKKETLSKLKKKQQKKKRRSSWSDSSSESNPNTPRSKNLEDIVVSPRPQTTTNVIMQSEGEKEL